MVAASCYPLSKTNAIKKGSYLYTVARPRNEEDKPSSEEGVWFVLLVIPIALVDVVALIIPVVLMAIIGGCGGPGCRTVILLALVATVV